MRTPVERAWHATMLAAGHEGRVAGGASPDEALALLYAGMGCTPPYPGSWQQASAMILADEARYLAAADLYVLTPEMLAVVTAAAQTLGYDDLALLRADDLPGPPGLLILPQPLRIRHPAGTVEGVAAYTWRTPWGLPLSSGRGFDGAELPAVRLSSYAPQRASPDFRREARRHGAALPPILLDSIWPLPLHAATAAQRHDQQHLEARLRQLDASYWDQETRSRAAGPNAAAEYEPGTVLDLDDPATFGSGSSTCSGACASSA
jgi:hypothetical protein